MKTTWFYILRVALALQLAFAPTLAYAKDPHPMSVRRALGSMYEDFIKRFKGSNTTRFSGVNVFSEGRLAGSRLWLESFSNGRTITDFNRYRVAYGFSVNEANGPRPSQILIDKANGRLPYLLEPNAKQIKADLMKTEAGRARLIYELQWLRDGVSVHNNVDLEREYKSRSAELSRQSNEELRKDPRTKHLYNEFTDQSRKERANRSTIKSLERMLKAELDANTRTGVRNLIIDTQGWFKNKVEAAKWAVRYGVTTFRANGNFIRTAYNNVHSLIPLVKKGATQAIDVVDPVSKRPVRLNATLSAEQLKNFKASEAIQQMKNGAVPLIGQTAAFTAFFGTIMFAYQQIMFQADFAANPMRMEQIIEEFTGPAFYTSMFGFLMGARLGNMGQQAAQSLIRTNIQAASGLHAYFQADKLHSNNPVMRDKIARGNIAAMSMSGLAVGFLGASFLHKWVGKLHACNQLFYQSDNEGDAYRSPDDPTRPINQARIPQWKKSQLAEQCNKNFVAIMKEVMTDDDTYARLLSLFSAKGLLLMFDDFRSRQKYGHSLKAGREAGYVLSSNGYKAPRLLRAWRFIKGTGAFLIVSELAYQFAIRPKFDEWKYETPLRRYKENFSDLMTEFRENNYNTTGICKYDQFFDGRVWGTTDRIHRFVTNDYPLSNESLEVQTDTAKRPDRVKWCNNYLYSFFLEDHNKAEEAWRGKIMKPVSDRITQWMQYTSQSLNIYRATRVLYKDIYDQVRIMREQKIPSDELFPKRARAKDKSILEDYPTATWEAFDHPLPLFRSTPYFGFSVVPPGAVTPAAVEEVSISGLGLDWRQRYEIRHGQYRLRNRMASFISFVTPMVIEDLHRAIELMDGSDDLSPRGKHKLASLRNIVRFLPQPPKREEKEVAEVDGEQVVIFEEEPVIVFEKDQGPQSLEEYAELRTEYLTELKEDMKNMSVMQWRAENPFHILNPEWQVRRVTFPIFTTKFEDLINKIQNKDKDIEKKSKEESEAKPLGEMEIEYIVWAMELIAEQQRLESQEHGCQLPDDFKELNADCPFSYIQKKYMNPRLWSLDKERNEYRFKGQRVPLYHGYQRASGVSPFGIQPLSRGQEFLLNYEERLQSPQVRVDTYYHDIEKSGMNFISMTDYLLKSMICGPSAEENQNSLFKRSNFAFKVMGAIPEYHAPAFPMVGRVNPCGVPTHKNTQGTGKWANGWEDASGFYHFIVDKDDPSKSYGGVVEFLYNEMDFEKVPDFDAWWDENVKPQFEVVIADLYNKYIERVVNKDLRNALLKGADNYENSRHTSLIPFREGKLFLETSMIGAMKNQMENYFDQVIEPMVRELPLDTCYAGEERITDYGTAGCDVTNEHRQRIINDFLKYKTQFFSLLEYYTGEKQTLKDPELIALLDEIREGMYANTQEVKNYLNVGSAREMQVKSQFEGRMMKAAILTKLNDMRLILKADNKALIEDEAEAYRDAINQDERLTEIERQAAMAEISAYEAISKQLYDDSKDRLGNVLVHHVRVPQKDINGDQIYKEDGEEQTFKPSGNVMFETLDYIADMTDEMLDVLENRDQLMDLDQIDVQITR